MKRTVSLLLVICIFMMLPGCTAMITSDNAAKPDAPEIAEGYEDLKISYGEYEVSFFNIERKGEVLSFDMRVMNNTSAMMQDPYVALDEAFAHKLNRLSYKMNGDADHIEYSIEDDAEEIYIMPPVFVEDISVDKTEYVLPSPERYSAAEPFIAQYEGKDWFSISSIEKNEGGEVVIKIAGCAGADLVPSHPSLVIGENVYHGGVDFAVNCFGGFDEQNMVFQVAPTDVDELDSMTLIIEEVFHVVSADAPNKLNKK